MLQVAALCLLTSCSRRPPLPSWNNGPAKTAILSFVEGVTREGGREFVPRRQRIAVFDGDGTLWSEQPMPPQLAFVFDRIKELGPRHPEWKQTEPFKSVLEGDIRGALARSEDSMDELLAAVSAGMTAEEFDGAVTGWLATARHPLLNRRYTDLVFQPMADLIAYLQESGFETIVVSRCAVDFIRPMAARTYRIAPMRVVGGGLNLAYEVRGERPALFVVPTPDPVGAKAGKPESIQRSIGQKPILAVGNSDRDREMIEWVTSGAGSRLGMIVHHTDEVREWAYDRGSSIGRLNEALSEAEAKKWLIIDMKRDWKVVHPFQQ
ncbi:MAG: haloacid dehalogenase-like hydrolase [Acidobacteria bacterium]|nr:haloacid dehalogenase-like hydrolase [Acidobacteriota bacterium]